jgi:Ca2+-transporting ATPase
MDRVADMREPDPAISGLSSAEAEARLRTDGPNELPGSRRRGSLAAAADVLCEPMFLLLIACGGLYMLLGDRQEALMLLGFLFVVAAITLYQERKTERALDALRELSSPRALVVRDGERRRVAGRDVVRGDVLVLFEGDRVPADAALLQDVAHGRAMVFVIVDHEDERGRRAPRVSPAAPAGQGSRDAA